MHKIGYISEYDPKTGFAKVEFKQDEIVSGWLQAIVQGSKENKHQYPYAVGEQVACILSADNNSGVILGALYSKTDEPDADLSNGTTHGVVYKDAAKDTYDTDSHERIIELPSSGTLTLTIGNASVEVSNTSCTIKVGATEHTLTAQGHTIKMTESLKAVLEEIVQAVMALTVPTGVGPSGPPINIASFAAALGKLSLIFEA